MKKVYTIVRPRLHADFQLPKRKDLLRLKSGDSVKLMFKVGEEDVERIWVTLTDTTADDLWIGTVDNDATQLLTAHILPAGKVISFHPLDIIATY
jgi:prolyl-tRNA synthetase